MCWLILHVGFVGGFLLCLVAHFMSAWEEKMHSIIYVTREINNREREEYRVVTLFSTSLPIDE